MIVFYINDNEDNNGYHEVHKDGCYWLEKANSKTKLGLFDSCQSAVKYAKDKFPHYKVDGCGSCSPLCHKENR